MVTRPLLLVPERQQKIVTAIAAGNSRDTAAAYAGITPKTFFEWLRRGREAHSGVYYEFAQAVEQADAEAELVAVATIRQAMPFQWQAAAWWLERKRPNEWGKRDPEVTVNVGVRVDLSWDDGEHA